MFKPEKADRLGRLLAAWRGQRRGGPVPAHADLRPDDLRFMLPDLCLIGVQTDGSYHFRLVGTGIAERLRHDPTGKGLDSLPRPTAATLTELFDRTAERAWPMAASGRLDLGATDRVLDALCLPYADAGGAIAVLLLGLHVRAWREIDAIPPLGTLQMWPVETAAGAAKPVQWTTARSTPTC